MRLPKSLVVILGIGALLGALLVLLLVSISLAGFDNEGSAPPIRAATIDDLPHIVLQPEDLPDEFVHLTEDKFSRLKKTGGEYSSIASYETAFALPREQAQAGDTVCVVSIAALYTTSEAARAALREPIRQLGEVAQSGGEAGSQIQNLSSYEPERLAQAIAASYFNPSTSYCADYEDDPAGVHLVRFEDEFSGHAVVGTVTTFVYGEAGSSDDALALAERQEDGMREWLANH
jgi:hypothetical protein